MSVPAYLRSESKAEYITVAVRLAAWALKWCKDERLFTRRERWIVTGDVWDSAKNALKYVKMANARSVTEQQDFEVREGYLSLALDCLVALKLLLTIKYEMMLKGFDAAKRAPPAAPDKTDQAQAEGQQPAQPKKSRGGNRRLTQEDVDRIFETFFEMAIHEEGLIRGVMRSDAERHAKQHP